MSYLHDRDLVTMRVFALDMFLVLFDSGGPTDGLPGRIGQQVTNCCRSFACSVSKTVFVVGLILYRHQDKVRAQLLALGQGIWVVDESRYRFGSMDANSGNRTQQLHDDAAFCITFQFFADTPSQR